MVGESQPALAQPLQGRRGGEVRRRPQEEVQGLGAHVHLGGAHLVAGHALPHGAGAAEVAGYHLAGLDVEAEAGALLDEGGVGGVGGGR